MESGQVPDDQALVAEAQCGRLESFECLVVRHQAAAYRVALRMLGDSDLAREASIVAFGKAFQGLAGFNGRASFRTWLLRILVNQCNTMRAQRTRHARRHVSVHALSPENPLVDDAPLTDPRQEAADHEMEIRIRDAVERLPDRLRTAWLLFATENLTVAEIAVVCGTTPGAIKSRLFHARRKLAHWLGPILE